MVYYMSDAPFEDVLFGCSGWLCVSISSANTLTPRCHLRPDLTLSCVPGPTFAIIFLRFDP